MPASFTFDLVDASGFVRLYIALLRRRPTMATRYTLAAVMSSPCSSFCELVRRGQPPLHWHCTGGIRVSTDMDYLSSFENGSLPSASLSTLVPHQSFDLLSAHTLDPCYAAHHCPSLEAPPTHGSPAVAHAIHPFCGPHSWVGFSILFAFEIFRPVIGLKVSTT